MKHQTKCYRIIGGVLHENYCDLIMSDEENAAVVAEAKKKFSKVRKIKHPSGYHQLFVSNLNKFVY